MSHSRVGLNSPFQATSATAEYGRTLAGTIALLAGSSALAGLLLVIGSASRLPVAHRAVPIQFIQMDEDVEDGNPDGGLELESSELAIRDPAPPEFQTLLEMMVELSDSTSQQVDNAIRFDVFPISRNYGGTARSGNWTADPNGSKRRIPREKRWRIKFDSGDLATYTKQLDFFKIELGALFKDGRLIFIKNMSAAKPISRAVQTGKGESRLYMTWRGGTRRQADVALFRKAGVPDADDSVILHFYAPETEQILARTEVDYRNRKSSELRTTYFTVEEDGTGFKFVVSSQSYLR